MLHNIFWKRAEMSSHDAILRGVAHSPPSPANPFLMADMAQDRLGRAPKLYASDLGPYPYWPCSGGKL